MVESQHQVSTMKLVDTLAEQDLLERVVERSKPAVPAACRHLHYLLATPFRYGAPYPRGSRFRRAGLTPGVFYGSREPITAMAETAFHRLLFFAESPRTPWPINPGEFTAFAVEIRTRAALDLDRAPFDAARAVWTHVTDYEPCQRFAEIARDAAVEVLLGPSARDPEHRPNVTLLTCRAFAAPAPVERQTWRLALSPSGARAVAIFSGERAEYGPETFADDPRIAGLTWNR
jgi:hypothetical protein